MKQIYRWMSILTCACLGCISLPGCNQKPAVPPDYGNNAHFSDVWTAGVSHSFGSEGTEFTLDVKGKLGAKNYLKLDFETACNLDGTLFFVNSADGSETYEERFYLPAGDTEFRQILDFYRKNRFEKTLDRISFRCVGGKTGEFRLKKISAATHPIDFSEVNFFDKETLEEEMQVYASGETVKLGVTLKSGGAINFLSSVNQSIGLSVEGNTVKVGETSSGLYADDINLINEHDTGRLAQQSFYGTKGDSLDVPKDDYTCGTFDHDGLDTTPEVAWPYNPVQGGDKNQNFSQLVDVQVKPDSIYVKCRPMDWAKDGSVTPFYMENSYAVRDDPNFGEYVEVKNRCTDFSGYAHNNPRDQELPAFYGITPLHTLITYTGNKPWEDGGLAVKDRLDFWSPQTPENRFEATENWIAWVNDDRWGIGLYVPDVTTMLAGRNEFTVDVSEIGTFPHLAVPCTYTAPLGIFSLETYQSFSYTYYLKLDYAEQSRSFFSYLHEGGARNADILKMEGK